MYQYQIVFVLRFEVKLRYSLNIGLSSFGGGWLQNGTVEEVKKIVTLLNEAEVPSEDVVGEFFFFFVNFC